LALPIAVTGSVFYRLARSFIAQRDGKSDDFQRHERLRIIRAIANFFIAFFMDAEKENRYANVFFFC
jgi:uncharacterized protein YdiU (UPF0061 family)